MSFTDNMYDAMREFYFRGSPYPAHVGIEEGSAQKSDTIDERVATDLGKEEASDSDEENVPVEVEPREEDSSIGLSEEERVNCYSSRPSSAVYITNESPPIWFKPMEVFEVSFADMTLSRQHTAAAGLVDDEGRGVALRFPRFKRRRPDKHVDQATTTTQIAQMFAQQSKQGRGG
jgi:hypothetical protein